MRVINKIKLSILCILFFRVIFSIEIFAVTGIVTEITVNVREEASTNSKRIMYVTQDDKVDVLEKDGDWYKIKYNNKTGYVFAKYIKVDETKTNDESTETSSVNNEDNKETTESVDIQDNIDEEIQNINVKLYIKSNTNIKLVPSPLSSDIYTSEDDKDVTIIEQIGKWSYIMVNNINGWVETEQLIEKSSEIQVNETKKDDNEDKNQNNDLTKDNDENEINNKILYVAYSSVNLRKEPSTKAKIVAKLKLNNEVEVVEETNSEWYKIKFGNVEGYVSSTLLSSSKIEETKKTNDTTSRDGSTIEREDNDINNENKEEELDNNNSIDQNVDVEKVVEKKAVTGEEIAEYAKQFLGYKYVYGGASTSGFDCSGLVYYVYKHFGYTLSRASTGQAKNGKEVAKSDLQPGDILIFKNNALTKIGHVGIYIGDNKMIHASEPGVGVIITDIDSKAYKYPQRYVTARRII